MNRKSLLEPEYDDRSCFTGLDPLLYGVAQGLAHLFPPIQNARRGDDEEPRGASEDEESRDDA